MFQFEIVPTSEIPTTDIEEWNNDASEDHGLENVGSSESESEGKAAALAKYRCY